MQDFQRNNHISTPEEVRPVMRALAEQQPLETGMLSVYLDLRPRGEHPLMRADLIRLLAHLSRIADSLWPRGPHYDAFQREVALLVEELVHPFPGNAQGVALFIQPERMVIVVAAVPFVFEVALAPVAHLYQLARLLDSQESAVVTLADHQTVRLFALRLGAIDEQKPVQSEARAMRVLQAGGNGEWHYAHHLAEHQRQFAQESVQAIAALMEEEHAERLLLLGNAEMLALIKAELPPVLISRLIEIPLTAEIDSLPKDVRALVLPVLQHVEDQRSQSLAEQLLAAFHAHGLGVIGYQATEVALRAGQVETLILTTNAPLDELQRNLLVQLATATGARVEFVDHHDALQHAGGVGALLRFRLDANVERRSETHASRSIPHHECVSGM